MNLLHTVMLKARQRPASLLVACALLLLGVGQVGVAVFAEGAAPGRRPNPERREAMQRQQAEAMAKLTSQQRQAYFAARRQLEQRSAGERLEQLSQAERCIVPARDLAAVEGCQRTQLQQTMQQRRQQMADLVELQRRFGLPSGNPGPRPSRQGV